MGCALFGFWAMGVSTSYRCFGKMAPPPISNAYKKAAYGSFSLKTTVSASGAVSDSTFSISPRVRGVLDNTFSYENTTSADENGFPSCQVTPGCRWNVYVSLSSDTSHDLARLGSGLRSNE